MFMAPETTILIKKEKSISIEQIPIKNAHRKKMTENELREALEAIRKLRGSAKRKITDEEYERAREEAFYELGRERGWIK